MQKKLLSRSFWLIMAIHLIVFTSIGLFTVKGWRLLIVFLTALVLMLLAWRLLNWYSKQHPQWRHLASFLAFLQKR